MKIASIETVTVNVPFHRRHRSHGRVGRGVTRTIVKVHSDTGITGLGETLHYQSKYVIDHVLAPAIVGQDPRDLAKLRMRFLPGLGMPGTFGRAWESDPWAYSGVEMALYDVLGKAVGRPLHELWGGRVRDRVPFTAYYYPPADETAPEVIADGAVAVLAKMRAETLEVKVGVHEPQRDVDTIRRLRERIGSGTAIRIDANGGWSPRTAIRTLDALEPYGLANVEEPCRGLAPLADIRKETSIPLSTHCADATAVARLRAADNIVFDLPSEGGLDSAREAAAAAASLGLGFWMRSTGELGIATAAIVHLAAATPSMVHANQTVLHLLDGDVVRTPFSLEDGSAGVPEAPGLGVDLDEGLVREYARRFDNEGPCWFWAGPGVVEWEPPRIW
ncbi:MAG TPA: mandelate racemase/muconate lactonizing enzyme family protein [bacterium]|nr:mandelate racemase/muconate lactonizing enzyme family protein [bacterium]